MTHEEPLAATPRSRFREMVQEDILAAARQIMQRDGYQALSMRSLASAVGMRASSLYDYFASKDDVLNAIFLQGIEVLSRAFADHISATEPGIERLMALGMEYRRFALANPDIYLLIFSRIDRAYLPGTDQIAAARRLFAGLVDQVTEAIAAGALLPHNAELLAMTFWSMAHGYVSLELVGHLNQDAVCCSSDDQYHFALSALLEGLHLPADGTSPLQTPGPVFSMPGRPTGQSTLSSPE